MSKRFENFMSINLNKGRMGSCEWLSKILDDDNLTFEATGVLFMLGEKLSTKAFSIKEVLKLRDTEGREQVKSVIDTLCLLDALGYLTLTVHRDEYTKQDVWDYFETFL